MSQAPQEVSPDNVPAPQPDPPSPSDSPPEAQASPDPVVEAPHPDAHAPHGNTFALALGALGVVFGDIGTSPLYTVQECFFAGGARAAEQGDVLGVLSLIFWSLLLVVTFKYVVVLMRADNHGEGGIMALLSLVPKPQRAIVAGRIGWVSLLVIAGASLLFGDGIITPAISVLSAMEGLSSVDPRLARFVIPSTVVLLVLLFSIQSRGTGALGRLFGPVMLVWFATLGVTGIANIMQTKEVLWAMLPHHAALYFAHHGVGSLHLLGSVVLAVTGGEGLYADMGHFGRKPIRMAWLWLVLPCLLLSYFGQGALLLRNPGAASSGLFYSMVTGSWARLALVVLAAMSTVIASQGLISALFSLTQQAVRLGYLPRVRIDHTSREIEGQIYVPMVNWGLAICCIALVLSFQQSARLAAAYGLAVSGCMAITSVVFFSVARHNWKWPFWKAASLTALFLSFDLPFLSGACLKFFDGGYIPFATGTMMFILMVTWCGGRSLVRDYILSCRQSVDHLRDLLKAGRLRTCDSLGVYLSSSSDGLPHVLMLQVQRFESISREVILLTVTTETVPYVDDDRRVEVKALEMVEGVRMWRVLGRYGFMEQPDVPLLLQLASPKLELSTELGWAQYVLGRESFAATNRNRMGALREGIYSVLSDLAQDVSFTFNLPPEQVVEIGTRLDL